jgi:PAS domain S-box-containing protein
MKKSALDKELRKRAEEQVGVDAPVADAALSEVDVRALLHDLQVHQIELELQNEELLLAQAEVKAGLEQYRDLYDYAPVGYFSFDHDGSIRKVNLTGAMLLLFERSRLIGRRMQLFLTSETRGTFTAFLERVFLAKIHLACEVALHFEGGMPVFVRIEAEASEEGQFCLAAVTDISERRQLAEKLRNAHDKLEETVDERTRELTCANMQLMQEIEEHKLSEEALRLSEERFRAIFERSTIGKSLTAVDGTLLKVNKALADMLGYTVAEFHNLNFAQISHPDDVAESQENIRLLLEGKQASCRFEKRFIHKNGTIVWADISSTLLLDEQGTPLHLITSIVDITERKLIETQFFQAQKMEAIGQLAGGIAHDFNNALTIIIGFTNLIEMEMERNRVDHLRENISHVLAAANKAAELTRSLLAFSRKQILNIHTVDLNQIIENTEKFLHRIIGEDIALKTIIHQDLLAVNVDSGQIEQVLMNLVVNARDAMPHGGMLTIETGYALMDAGFNNAHGFGEAGKYALVTISDSGTGMDKVTRKRMFEPFFTTKELGKGTGLGLSIVYGIVKQHNGFIDVDSEPGVGTTFSIYLPLTKAEIKEETGHVDKRPKMGTETLLVADDDASILELTVKVLEQFGYTVITAGDGLDVVNKFGENREKIALVILDVMMPKMNGKEAYDEIRKIRPDMKAIFVSGYTADIINSRGMLDESLEYIAKPLKFTKLLQKVREVLDGK